MEIFKVAGDIFTFEDIHKRTNRIIYFLPPKFSKDLSNSVLYSSIWTLDNYYSYLQLPVDVGYQHSVVIREMLKNARWHGGSKENSPTHFGLFIDRDKFCFGCNDGGDYFKREDIKDVWENKKDLREFHESENPEIGRHYGYSYFKYKFHEILVDVKNGTLYGFVNMDDYLKEIKKE